MAEGRTDDRDHSPREQALVDLMGRQTAVLTALRADAAAATDGVEACLAWLGVARQATRTLGVARRWRGSRGYRGAGVEIDAHCADLQAFADEAQASAAGFDERDRRAAESRLGIRLVVVGKGGAGKTAFAGTLARLLARRGRKVLAADLDTNPGLAFSLGLPQPDLAGGLPLEAVEEHRGGMYGWQLASDVTPAGAVERFSVPAPDGVRFLGLAKIDESEKLATKQSVGAVLQILRGFGEPDWDLIGDMEAGPTTPFERYYSFADRALVVVGPAWRSALTARRLLRMIDDIPTSLVADRVRDQPDHPGLVPAFRIPFDPDVVEAERLGLAPLDECPGSPFVAAVAAIADSLLETGNKPEPAAVPSGKG